MLGHQFHVARYNTLAQSQSLGQLTYGGCTLAAYRPQHVQPNRFGKHFEIPRHLFRHLRAELDRCQFFRHTHILVLTGIKVKCILLISQYTHIDMKATSLQQEQLRGRVQVIDVRSGAEWRTGHITGAEHMPLDELEGGQTPKSAASDKVLVLVCQSGVRAEKAQLLLKARGIEAEVLEGGMNAWVAAGLPQEQEEGRHGISLMRQVQLIIGSINLISLGAGLLHSPWWLTIPLFTSTGLLVAGISGTCGLALLLARMPWNR